MKRSQSSAAIRTSPLTQTFPWNVSEGEARPDERVQENQEKKPLTRSPLMPRNPLVPLEKQKKQSIIQILTTGEPNLMECDYNRSTADLETKIRI